jgi:hypothetical protein
MKTTDLLYQNQKVLKHCKTNNNQQAKRKGGNNQVAAFLFVLPCSYSI